MHVRGLIYLSAIFISIVPIVGHAATTAEYATYGDTLYEQGNYTQALQYYSHAAELDSNMWQAWYGISKCYYQQGSFEDALKYISHACKLNPGDSSLADFRKRVQSEARAASGSEKPTDAAPITTGATIEAKGTRKGSKWPKLILISADLGLITYAGMALRSQRKAASDYEAIYAVSDDTDMASYEGLQDMKSAVDAEKKKVVLWSAIAGVAVAYTVADLLFLKIVFPSNTSAKLIPEREGPMVAFNIVF